MLSNTNNKITNPRIDLCDQLGRAYWTSYRLGTLEEFRNKLIGTILLSLQTELKQYTINRL
jgi:hypothetical protein